jgi:hypothetical protein
MFLTLRIRQGMSLTQGWWSAVAKEIKFEFVKSKKWDNSNKVIWDSFKKAMEEICEDAKAQSEGMTPHKTGYLETHTTKRWFERRDSACWFEIQFIAHNPRDGFDYAKWTNDETYNLGKGSLRKRPYKGKFAKGVLKVGNHYIERTIEACEDNWEKHILKGVKYALKRHIG